MLKYVIGVRKFILFFTFTNLLCTVSLALIPLINKGLFDTITSDASHSLHHLVLSYIIVIIVHLTFAYLSNLTNWKLGIEFEKNVKNDFFETLSKMSYSNFKSRKIGEYISILSNDITAVEADFLTPLVSLGNQFIILLVYSFILFAYVDWRVAVSLFVASIIMLAIPNFTSKKLAEKRKNYSDMLGEYTSRVSDFLEGKLLFNRVTIPNFIREHESARKETARKRYAFGSYKSLVLPLNAIPSFTISIISFIVVGYLMLNNQITIGTGVAALGYIEAFLSPLHEIVYDITTIASTKKLRKKVLDLLSVNTPTLNVIDSLQSAIELNNVSIELDDFAIKGLNFAFQKGKKFAIIGRNGSGKSTVLKMIMKQIELSAGTISVDGKDIASLDTGLLICYVSQHNHIFRDGFDNNASVFSSYKLDESSVEALIGGNKYNLLKKQMNCQNLSGGEKQIISIARMITENKPVCILDEPFSDIDMFTASYITRNILNAPDKTMLIVTHNLSDELSFYDEVVLMDNGNILLHGKYDDIKNTLAFRRLKAEAEVQQG